jgi:NADPH2:quinone reductase
MKSWWISSETGSTVLELREVPVPEPKAGEMLVRVRAASLNRGEFIAGHGLHGAGGAKPAGLECAGEVVKASEGATGFKPGDRVMGRGYWGFAEFAIFRPGEAMPVPARLTWEEAAAGTIVYTTAYDMLYPSGELKAGEWLLVTGASSGVGVASIQLAKLIGARVIGTSGSAEKLGRLEALGLDIGICVRGAGFAERVMEVTSGKGVDLVVNNVGGSVFAECVRVMAYKGRLATVGYVDGVLSSEIDLMALHGKRLRLFGVSSKMRSPAEIAENVRGFVRGVLPAVEDGRVRPVVDRVFPFEELPQAKAYMESNAHVGKIVVTLAE